MQGQPDRRLAARQRHEQTATRLAFFIAGFGMAAWAPLVPLAKARTGADDGQLGLLLLCLGAGSILAMPLAGALAGRFGCRRVVIASTVLIGLTLPLLATLPSLSALGLALFVFGAGMGALDCTMNLQAVIVERESGRTLMSGFHGLFSLGGIAGAAGVSALLGAGASPLAATLVVAALIAGAIVRAAPHLLARGAAAAGPFFAVPRGIVLLLGAMCFVVFLAEGAMLDWSAVFLADVRALPAAQAGWGYAAFAVTMTIGRLTGDRIVRRLGHRAVVMLGGFCAAAGFGLATALPEWQAALVGFALIGAGCANIVPVMYSMVGRQQVMPERLAVPAITTVGYAGILLGPALIGGVARASSLPVAFLGVAALLVAVAMAGGRLRP
jgi:predicted MFS family arabinose efflux permease